MTIAEKYLSKHGRYGDTEIVETSDGSLWHVSNDEKRLIESYGKHGEELVNNIGSGTINPTTGLEEKWAWLIPAAAVALTSITGAAAGKAQEDSARTQAGYAQKGIDIVGDSLSALSESTRKAREGITASFEKKLSDFSDTFGYKKQGLRKSIEKAKSGTGFAKVQIGDEDLEMLNKSIESGMGDLQFAYGSEMGKESAREKIERSKLESEKLRFEQEKELLNKQANSWYLGKNIMNLFS